MDEISTSPNPRDERGYIHEGIKYRIRKEGYHEHCLGCEHIQKCGMPADPKTIIECAHRPGPLMEKYQWKK